MRLKLNTRRLLAGVKHLNAPGSVDNTAALTTAALLNSAAPVTPILGASPHRFPRQARRQAPVAVSRVGPSIWCNGARGELRSQRCVVMFFRAGLLEFV